MRWLVVVAQGQSAGEVLDAALRMELGRGVAGRRTHHRTVGPQRSNEGEAVVLPAAMSRAFNELQQHFGFANRAQEDLPIIAAY